MRARRRAWSGSGRAPRGSCADAQRLRGFETVAHFLCSAAALIASRAPARRLQHPRRASSAAFAAPPGRWSGRWHGLGVWAHHETHHRSAGDGATRHVTNVVLLEDPVRTWVNNVEAAAKRRRAQYGAAAAGRHGQSIQAARARNGMPDMKVLAEDAEAAMKAGNALVQASVAT